MNAPVSKQKPPESKTVQVAIKAPDIRIAQFNIVGTSPYVQNKFSEKAKMMIKATQEGGNTSKSKKVREPKDFSKVYREAMHLTAKGKAGVPAAAFRSGMISACRLVGYKMTIAKMSVFIVPDDFDADDGTPLVHINGDVQPHLGHARNDNGSCDLRCRPMWKEWSITLNVQYDADQFTQQDVANLLSRVGIQVGIGEGRHDSRDCAGIGWGTFRIDGEMSGS